MRKSDRQKREYRFIRHALASTALLFLGSLAAAGSIGQVPKPVSAAESLETAYDSEKGRALYATYCSACHGTDGEGHSGTYPPIKGSGVVTKDEPTKHIQVVLNGLQGAKAGGVLYTSPMPPFGSVLNDAELTDIIDYERSSWGNHSKLVTPARVAAQRGSSK
jgi:cytochrome c oxidase cbb3-type subunit II